MSSYLSLGNLWKTPEFLVYLNVAGVLTLPIFQEVFQEVCVQYNNDTLGMDDDDDDDNNNNNNNNNNSELHSPYDISYISSVDNRVTTEEIGHKR